MTLPSPEPPSIDAAALPGAMAAAGFAVLDALQTARCMGWPTAPLDWGVYWRDLPPDRHLRDGGRYRRRRHGCFVVEGLQVQAVPARAHWQPLAYNALHGGIERWFEPLPPALVADPRWGSMLRALARIADECQFNSGAAESESARAAAAGAGPQRWFAEAHLFRIDTTDGIGRPTPEGAHRDGVDLVAVFLVARSQVKGGETRVFAAQGPQGVRFTLTQGMSLLLLDDARVMHESTPIQPLHPDVCGCRDTLVVTLRRGGFQAPPPSTGAAAVADRPVPGAPSP